MLRFVTRTCAPQIEITTGNTEVSQGWRKTNLTSIFLFEKNIWNIFTAGERPRTSLPLPLSTTNNVLILIPPINHVLIPLLLISIFSFPTTPPRHQQRPHHPPVSQVRLPRHRLPTNQPASQHPPEGENGLTIFALEKIPFFFLLLFSSDLPGYPVVYQEHTGEESSCGGSSKPTLHFRALSLWKPIGGHLPQSF